MGAGIVFGPNTPGIELFGDPACLEILAALGLIFPLLYIGLEFSVDELASGGPSLLLAGGAYLPFNVGGGAAVRPGARMGEDPRRSCSPACWASPRRRSSASC
jgi:Kef-type K+ transport system membrane component KefB